MKDREQSEKNGNGTGNESPADSTYLRLLGNAIRAVRSRKGMTRKTLAAHSGVSERFLAHLESGAGNASVLLLGKIASALDVPIDALLAAESSQSSELTDTVAFLKTLDAVSLKQARNVLRERFAKTGRESRRERVALVGLRGAGKSTLGARAASRLGWPFIELDKRVEQASGISLGMIFDMYGQSGFRRLEYRCLDEVLRSEPYFVLAAGGSIVSEPGTYDLLLSHCFTVWLRTTPEEHMQRVIAQGDMRPMAESSAAMADLTRILEEREDLYRKADSVVDTSRASEEESLDQLLAAVKPRAYRGGQV